MLILPSKKWKKVRICQVDLERYSLFILAPVKNMAELRKIAEDDIEECLGPEDRIISLHLDDKSVTLEIADIEYFKRRLLYLNIDVVE